MKILITGSLGLVGSEAVSFYLARGHEVIGVDNDMRKEFFGPAGSGIKNKAEHPRYDHYSFDVGDVEPLILDHKPDAVIHCAAQPSHDWAAKNPWLDFTVNATNTLVLLEACRKYCPESPFVFLSTNKVYGDNPNKIPVLECGSRYEYFASEFEDGIDETMSIDHCTHSLFGVSKAAADLMVQEYGRYFGMKTGVFRCGCITGARHSGVQQHGFLSYMAKCKKENMAYHIFGYRGKQVRDNIHAFDLVKAIDEFISDPDPGAVYNMGGGMKNNVSVIEALKMMGVSEYYYHDEVRTGDHRWYISNVSKFRKRYPKWDYSYSMEKIIEDLLSSQPV